MFKCDMFEVGNEILEGETDEDELFFIDNYHRKFNSYDGTYYVLCKKPRGRYCITHRPSGVSLMPCCFDTKEYAEKFVSTLLGLQGSFFDWEQDYKEGIFFTEEGIDILKRLYDRLAVEEGK